VLIISYYGANPIERPYYCAELIGADLFSADIIIADPIAWKADKHAIHILKYLQIILAFLLRVNKLSD
jgi:hypothetical protein